MKKLLLWVGLCLTPLALAASVSTVEPESIHIVNDEQVKLDLSDHDINRLFVVNDKITRVNAPDHRLMVHNDASGSLFMNVMGRTPFTAFILTQKGRHFSLFVVPKSEPGITVRFVPETPVLGHYKQHSRFAAHFERASPYEKTLVTLLRDVMLAQTPPGYSVIASNAFNNVMVLHVPPYLDRRRFLSERVVAGFLGGALAVRGLRVTNDSRHTVTLMASAFYRPGVRAVSIAKETLHPHQSTMIYEVISNA